MKANMVKIIALCAAAVFVVSTLAVFGPAPAAVGVGKTSSAESPMSVLGTTGDPTLPRKVKWHERSNHFLPRLYGLASIAVVDWHVIRE